MRGRIKVFVLSLLLQSPQIFAANDLAFSRNARTFETQQSSLFVKSVAHSCLTLQVVPDGLPCNPAHNAFNQKSSLGAELLLSNGYSNLTKIQKLLDNKINQEVVDTLFSEGKVIQIEANAELLFQSKYLSGRYTPLTLKGFSVVRNEANPDVELYAIEEKGFAFQSGIETFEDLFIGIQTRFIDRKYIRKRFKLVTLATQEGKDLLKPKQQTAAYFEPGMTYFVAKAWRPRVSVFVANLGTVSEENDDLKSPVEVQYGLGISPPVPWGDVELSLEYRSMNYEETGLQRIRAGAVYHFGSMYLSGGVDSNGVSGGVFYGLDKINAGILYSTTKLMNEEKEFYTQTVYVQLGWQI